MVNQARLVVDAVVLAGLTIAAWWLWMGWDTTYQVDAVTGARTGPYEPWQVVGCVLCLVVLAVVGAIRLPRWVVVLVMSVAFTVAWSMTAIATATGPLWGVGALMVFVGMVAGSCVVVAVVRKVRGDGKALSGT
ncbi:hypothetical protein [Amycolatopsis samaneae]|uniref:SPW repeat-containing protein n=1 Tax=Amycolatopsis samaneae TaxID=664691 RepID=A0ABW5G8E6_9PSEU